MKTPIAVVVFFLCSVLGMSLQAQSSSFYIGATAGANLSKFKLTEGLAELYPVTNPVAGVNGGFQLGFEIQNFTLSSGLQYIQKGSEYQTDNFEDEFGVGFSSATEKLHFLSVPVQLGYRFYLTPRFALSVAAGPSFNFGLGGKLDEETQYFGSDDTDVQNYTIRFGTGLNEDYKPLQMGFQFSPGIVAVLNEQSKLTFNVTWDSGMGDSFNARYRDANSFFDINDGSQKNSSTVFSVGYEYHFSFGDKY